MVCLFRAWRVLPVLAAALAFSEQADGQSPSDEVNERVRVKLSVPDSCAQGDRFFAQVRERLGTAWEAAPGELARTIHVTVSLSAERYVARIELTDARGRQVVRAVAGAECEQVIDSIALITVLAIQAQVDELISRSDPSEPSTPATKTTPSDPNVKAPGTPGKTGGSSARAPDTALEPAASAPIMKLRMAGRAGIQQGVGPGLATIFGGFFGVAWQRLALGLALDAAGTGWVRAQDVRADFDLFAGRLEGCWRLRTPAEALSVEPCAFVQGGNLSAQAAPGPGVSEGRRGNTLWLAPGLLAAMRGELGPAFLGLEVSAAFPLNQESFFVEVETRTVYRVPWITASAALSAGVVF